MLLSPPSQPSTVPNQNPDKIIRVWHVHEYPHLVWFCIAGVILLVAACHLTTLLWRAGTRPRSPPRPRKRGVLQYRRLPAAVLNAFRAIAFRWTIPVSSSYTLNFAEVFFTAAYIVILFVWTMARSTNLAGHRYDTKYWANVAGAIAASQFPLVAALGTKNNVITLLTGVNPDKLNYLHRMYARVLAVLIWLHAGGRIKLGIQTEIQHPYLRCGILAASSLTLLCFLSIRPLRKRNYEIFLVVHFTLVLILLLAAYFHTNSFSIANNYIWPAFIIWGADLLLRLLRTLLFNTLFNSRPRPALDGHVSRLSPHLLRITLTRPAHPHIRWSPGQSAYLRVVSWRGGFEAHPFTIASVDSTKRTGGNPKPDRERQAAGDKKLVFFVKVRDGFTKRLMTAVQDADQDMKFIVDGPYGTSPILTTYRTVVLIAAGSGVSFTLPLLLDQLSRMKRGKSTCTRIVFVWAIRDLTSISWIADDLVPALRDIPSTCTVDVRIHITGIQAEEHDLETLEKCPSTVDSEPPSPDDYVEAKTDEKHGFPRTEMPSVDVKFGRPDVKAILEAEIKNASGDISVNVCGIHGMISAVKHALSPLRFLDILKGGPSVNLHIETYGNA